ncbi:NAD-dependent epimerase/dehydratase [Streptosporangium sp. NPDC048865]|uniref:NAD-dependent epimerase/dehydratase family protein n=1 Tax=Streptosporangium sp. NPDC048865 TaxID=3155766 RepID=UPI00341912FE
MLGASGFVGSALVAALARRPLRLRAVARRPSVVPDAGIAEAEIRTADLTVPDEVRRAVAGSAAVIHLVTHSGGWRAADKDPECERVNVGVMRNLIAAVRDGAAGGRDGGPPLVVYAGAASQIGVPPDRAIDGSEPDHPETEYDRQKLAAETLLKVATAEGVLRGVTLRLPTVFGHGPVPDRGVVAFMIRRALDDERITMWHDGTVKRDLVYVEDIADAFVAALDHPGELAGRHWLLGAGRGDPLGEVFRAVAEIVAGHTGRPPVPVVCVEPPPGAPRTDFAGVTIDSSPFRAVTGWRPRVALRDALERTVTALAVERVGHR